MGHRLELYSNIYKMQIDVTRDLRPSGKRKKKKRCTGRTSCSSPFLLTVTEEVVPLLFAIFPRTPLNLCHRSSSGNASIQSRHVRLSFIASCFVVYTGHVQGLVFMDLDPWKSNRSHSPFF